MSVSIFLLHQLKKFWRGQNANRSLLLQIIIGLFYLLIFLEIAGLGIALPFFIEELMPGKDPVQLFCSYIAYYFLGGLLFRFQFQELPVLSLQPYLTQNIRRSSMIWYLNIRSVIHFTNFLPLFIFFPFILIKIIPQYGIVSGSCFLLAMYALVINNHFLNQYIKRKSINNSYWFVAIIILILLIKTLNYYGWLSFEQSSVQIFIGLLQQPFYCLVFIALPICSFIVNHQYLKKNLYLEELLKNKKTGSIKSYSFLNRMGGLGNIIALDLKLIFRNKRPKSLLILSAVILLYGFIFYPQYLQTGNYSMLFLFAMMITGLFISNYGQFLFSWQSSHFDGMMSYNFNVKQYLWAKLFLFISVCSLQLLLASIYGLMGWQIIPIQLAAYLYSIGVNSFVTIYAATFNYRYLNLNKSGSMNFQGVGSLQWLQSIFISFGPVLIFYLLTRNWGYWVAVIAISSLGISGLIFSKKIINWLEKQFLLRKHRILEGFRER